MRVESSPLALLGATGSIGQNTVDLVRRYADRYQLVALSARTRGNELALLAREFPAAQLCLTDPEARADFVGAHSDLVDRLAPPGEEGLLELVAGAPAGAMVLNGVVGSAGLRPTVSALERGLDVALANKEALVVGGQIVLEAAERGGGRLWPVDSEHSAIAQCLRGNPKDEIRRLWLTASGGPFRDRDPETFGDIELAEVLRHPTWDMGPKITVDSATMMNKGLEVLEAHLLFGTPLARVNVVIHRQSIIHSMVELRDGAFLAQLGAPDMRVPILYALSRGTHQECDVAPFNPLESPELTFEAPDPRRYPCLDLARQAGEAGGAAVVVLNAANEEAVAGLLRGELSFIEIAPLIERALVQVDRPAIGSVDDALALDVETRLRSRELVAERARSRS